MPKRTSFLNDLITLPCWFSLALAAVVYFGLKFYLPTVQFQSPAFQGIGKAFPNMAGMFASIFIFTAAVSAYHAWRCVPGLGDYSYAEYLKWLPGRPRSDLAGGLGHRCLSASLLNRRQGMT